MSSFSENDPDLPGPPGAAADSSPPGRAPAPDETVRLSAGDARRRIGRYPILRRLGRGGMGEVYLAEDPALVRRVALKRLPESLTGSGERMEDVRREARLLASLNHPNIATIYSLEDADGISFLTMEVIEGESLAACLARGPLDEAESLRVGRQIARALEAAHKRGIVHRDLKPGNVMFTADREIKVLDFGLAEPADSSRPAPPGDATIAIAPASADDRTSAFHSPVPASRSVVSGTPGYMSPEQLEGSPPDPRMDIWSFGCVLFECMTGSRAIPGATAVERMSATTAGALDLARLPASITPALRGLVERCLRRDAAERYPAMAEPRRIIEELLAERAFSTVRVAPPEAGDVPHNLPRHGASFIGRAAEIREVSRLLSEARMVTLIGIGGAGKTRLALQVAESLLGGFDGIWLVELAPLTEARDLATAVQKSIGLRENLDRPALENVSAHLASRRALLVLDNCEHLVEEAARVAAALLRDVPGLRILATSRERLSVGGEQSFAVPLLPVPGPADGLELAELSCSPAVELFLERARQARPGFELTAANAPAVAEICRRLDGIPLALELAAARLKTFQAEEVRQRLDDRFRLLTGGARDGLAHHRTLRAMIDWSYGHLPQDEQTLFRRLSVFAGSWTLEAAEAVAAFDPVPEWEILDLVTRLADKSLLEVDTRGAQGATLFRMLETVKTYAAEQRGEGPEAAATRQRHRDYFLKLVERAEPELTGANQTAWLARLDAAHEDLARVLEWSRTEEADPAMGLVLTGPLFRYWYLRGHWNEADAACRAALARVPDPPPSAHLARTLNAIATFALHRGQLPEARSYLQRASTVWAALDNPGGLAGARLNLGNVAFVEGDYDAAARDYAEGLRLSRELNRVDGINRALISLSNVALAQERFEDARDYARECLERARAQSNAELTAHALMALGAANVELGNLEEARRYLEESLEVQQSLGDRQKMANARLSLAVTLRNLKRLPESLHQFRLGLTEVRELGDVPAVAAALEGLAGVCEMLARWDWAVIGHTSASAIRERSGAVRMPQAEREIAARLGEARQALGEARYQELSAAARGMALEEAVAWALREIRIEGVEKA